MAQTVTTGEKGLSTLVRLVLLAMQIPIDSMT